MPRLVVTSGARDGLERCRRFLAEKNPQASSRAGQTIAEALTLLESTPEIGRPLDDVPHLRELIISYGDSGYVTLYRYDHLVYLLAFRHQKEAGHS